MQTIGSVEAYLRLDAAGLAATALPCPCGRTHTIPYECVAVGPGVLGVAAEAAARAAGRRPARAAVVYDRAIEALVEDVALPRLGGEAIALKRVALGERGHLLEPHAAEAQAAMPELEGAEAIISVGSGVITDLAKWMADRAGKPLVTCGTAVSMNAYTSIIASITEGGLKLNKYLRPAAAVVMDTDLLVTAPRDMTLAGLGDLAARTACNADWRLSQVVLGSYFCPVPFDLMAPYQDRYFADPAWTGRCSPEAVTLLAEATLISGYTMTMLAGDTYPSSGAEHVLSHFWDMQHDVRGAPKNRHGDQVAVGTLIALALYEALRERSPASFDRAGLAANRPSLEAVCRENEARFGLAAAGFNDVCRRKRLDDGAYAARLDRILDNWGALWAAVDPYRLPASELRRVLEAAGVPTRLDAIQRSSAEAAEALAFGDRYRMRYTVLDLAHELGLLPGAAEDILRRAGVTG
jgi:glycerol-1-phosphate dehydrogenase [NAD(P)+]